MQASKNAIIFIMPATLHVVTPGKLPLGSVARAAYGIRRSPIYEVVIADSFDYLLESNSAIEHIDAYGLLCRAAIDSLTKITDGQHVRCLSEILLPCTSCDLVWPVVFDVSRLMTLEHASTVFDKKVKNLLASETLLPCIISALAKTHQPYPIHVCVTEYPSLDGFLNAPTRPCPLPSGQFFITVRGTIVGKTLAPLPYLRQDPKTDVDKDHSTIYCTDTPAEIAKKVAKAYCQPADIETNPLLAYLEEIVFPYSKLVTGKPIYINDIVYNNIEEVRKDFHDDKITPQCLKKVMTEKLGEIVSRIQEFPKYTEAEALLKTIHDKEKQEKKSKKDKKQK
ncbi:Hypothetical protein GL50581_3048 [Giardia duodenalis ATCC 50581]|uniref:tyrosine--tRNA ligase n=2 Tax=Giardia intestinalis TaxID=5741 RepID=C6LW90_GIAIB|nr:Hypothetical protein GL50581_3048 [Giardia intestinalis ATCC 50581]